MKRSLMKAFAAAMIPLTLVAALSGCGESPAEAAHKPELAGRILTQSMQRCQLPEGREAQGAYRLRLNAVLNGAESQALRAIIDNGVTVCLDSRLPALDRAFLSSPVYGIFYNQDPANRVLSLWDNSRDVSETGFFTYTALTKGPFGIDRLARDQLSYPAVERDALAAFRNVSCGKNCITQRWRDVYGWSGVSGTLDRNPDILSPPLRTAAPMPAALTN